jgi:hypothetical protein
MEEIYQVPLPVNDSIDLARLSCLVFSSSVSRGPVALGLVVPVVSKLVAVLDYELGSRHDWNRKKQGNK